MKRNSGVPGQIVILSLFAFVAAPAAAQSPPLEIPFVHEWAASPHARMTDEAFTHWNDEGEIRVPCARCHSTPGFRDYIGADGTPPGLDGPAPVGTVISCVACHNAVTMEMDSVVFPSGAEIENVGDDARCMTCHQGRESTVSVNEKLGDKPEDTPDEAIRFINIHYRAAGATRHGTEAKGGYEYEGHDYVGFYTHDVDYQRCADCHQQHTVKIKVDECGSCHKKPRIESKDDLHTIRKLKEDFDGDGDVKEGIQEEIATLHDAVYQALQAYAAEVSGKALVYDAHAYPYFFNDNNANMKVDAGEAIYPNQYRSWTPRLLRSAYNYQYVAKDPGAYAHNPAYVIQLLHDSLESLGEKVPVDMEGMVRPSE